MTESSPARREDLRYGDDEASWLGEAKKRLARRLKVQREEDEERGLVLRKDDLRHGWVPDESGNYEKQFRPKRGER